MLIKKNVKLQQFVSCSVINNLKKQAFPFLPAYKKEKEITALVMPPLLWSLLAGSVKTKGLKQKDNKLLSSLYPINPSFYLQKKDQHFQSFLDKKIFFMLANPKKNHNRFTYVRAKEKSSQLKIVFKSYTSQVKDIKTSIIAIFTFTNFLNNFCTKQLNSFVTDSFNLPSFDLNLFSYQPIKIKNSNCSNDLTQEMSNSFNLLNMDFKTRMPLVQKKQQLFSSSADLLIFYLYPLSASLALGQNASKDSIKIKKKTPKTPLNLNLLMKQPFIEPLSLPSGALVFTESVGLTRFLENGKGGNNSVRAKENCLSSKIKTKNQNKNQSAFLFSMLQKQNYCNRYFFKSSACLDNNGPIGKQAQKTLYRTQLSTVIRSPFVFKKSREQFHLRKLFYSITLKLHSPVQKQFFIQCLGLLRLPVELEIIC